jgi:hypothetical protein
MDSTFAFLATNNLLKFVYYLDSSGFGKFMEMVFIKMIQEDRIKILINLKKDKGAYQLYNIKNQK